MLFEIHCHSTFSDGRATPKEIVEYAKNRLDGIAITDHDRIDGSLEALKYANERFTVIPGMEVSSIEGHILALNVRKAIPSYLSAKETVDAIHSMGGLAVAAHPYDLWRRGVGDLIMTLPFDAAEVINGHTFGSRKNVAKMCSKAGIAKVGGSDAHTLSEIGSVAVEFEGDILSSIKSGRIRVRSKPVPQLILNHGMSLMKRKILRRLRTKRAP
jgi:predicted metal-dependent phosphoesterase TrpH